MVPLTLTLTGRVSTLLAEAIPETEGLGVGAPDAPPQTLVLLGACPKPLTLNLTLTLTLTQSLTLT